ncbi:hypothetical protein GFY24_21925 [Nocardia sp. SYP-A9097]|uniref:hypothetical protein n=1 Tax=Nocardia sp. SYP-A9097 TaxID=2663237 RepID=UPI00129BA0F7|nr:hypothetical protein [Nocardia sp. SYP-A9097]MRH90066.1 hypothetical protein [Nocardia sp. SYP-A9097]
MNAELASELRRLAAEGSTGVLHAGDGAIHLTEGTIARADCRRTTGLDRLVVEAGVATPEEWQRAEAGDLGPLLHRPQLETLALLSVFDAAYFLLAAPTIPEFHPAPPHWLAPICRIAPPTLVEECARRGDPESGPWPVTLVDRVPVVPARRIPRRRVVLTGGQAEMLAAADARRSITTIANDLGRTTFGCLTAVRELTEAGLIEPPRPISVPRHAAEPHAAAPRNLALIVPARSSPQPAAAREPDPGSAAPDRAPLSVSQPSQLPRRRTRSGTTTPVSERWKPIDREVLVRVRAALEELA